MDVYDYNKEYDCSFFAKSKHFSKLMFYIININKIQDSGLFIENYIKNNKNEIDHKNEKGWTCGLES